MKRAKMEECSGCFALRLPKNLIACPCGCGQMLCEECYDAEYGPNGIWEKFGLDVAKQFSALHAPKAT